MPVESLIYKEFRLWVMFPEGRQMLQRHGFHVVFMDATHSTNFYSYKLVVVVVKDTKGVAFPAAFAVLSSTREEEIKPFLEWVLTTAGVAPPKYAVVDGDEAEHNALRSLGITPVMCYFHFREALRRNWADKNVKSVAHQAAIMARVAQLHATREKADGEAKLEEFYVWLDAEGLSSFRKYFESEWGTPTRAPMWMQWGWPDLHPDHRTTNSVERGNRTLKRDVMQSRINRRVGDLLRLLEVYNDFAVSRQRAAVVLTTRDHRWSPGIRGRAQALVAAQGYRINASNLTVLFPQSTVNGSSDACDTNDEAEQLAAGPGPASSSVTEESEIPQGVGRETDDLLQWARDATGVISAHLKSPLVEDDEVLAEAFLRLMSAATLEYDDGAVWPDASPEPEEDVGDLAAALQHATALTGVGAETERWYTVAHALLNKMRAALTAPAEAATASSARAPAVGRTAAGVHIRPEREFTQDDFEMGKTYEVDLTTMSCSCPAGTSVPTRRCKHVYAVRLLGLVQYQAGHVPIEYNTVCRPLQATEVRNRPSKGKEKATARSTAAGLREQREAARTRYRVAMLGGKGSVVCTPSTLSCECPMSRLTMTRLFDVPLCPHLAVAMAPPGTQDYARFARSIALRDTVVSATPAPGTMRAEMRAAKAIRRANAKDAHNYMRWITEVLDTSDVSEDTISKITAGLHAVYKTSVEGSSSLIGIPTHAFPVPKNAKYADNPRARVLRGEHAKTRAISGYLPADAKLGEGCSSFAKGMVPIPVAITRAKRKRAEQDAREKGQATADETAAKAKARKVRAAIGRRMGPLYPKGVKPSKSRGLVRVDQAPAPRGSEVYPQLHSVATVGEIMAMRAGGAGMAAAK